MVLFFITAVISFGLIAPAASLLLSTPVGAAPPRVETPRECDALGGTWTTYGMQDVNLGSCSVANNPYAIDSKGADWALQSYIYFHALGRCFAESTLKLMTDGNANISYDNALEGKWFRDPSDWGNVGLTVFVSPYMREVIPEAYRDDLNNDVGGSIACRDRVFIMSALAFWGYTPEQALCAFGFSREKYNANTCIEGEAGGYWYIVGGPPSAFDSFQEAILNRVYGGVAHNVAAPYLQYTYYRQAFQQSCLRGGEDAVVSPIASREFNAHNEKNTRGYSIFDVPSDGVMPSSRTYYIGAQDRDTEGLFMTLGGSFTQDGMQETLSCSAVESKINDMASDYVTYLRLHPNAGVPAIDEGGVAPGAIPSGQSSCPVQGIGWIVCPIINALSGLSDSMYNIIENILLMNPLTIDDPASGGVSSTYKLWQPIRDVANVLLVVAFLILIFSQLTNLGIDNYGIKKMLPRIIIAALAINLSYFAMMIAVDAANLMGRGIHDALSSIASSAWVPSGITFSWEGFFASLTAVGVGTVIGIGVAASVSFSALFLMALPFLLGAFLAILAAFLTLYIRNALVIILAVLAPLAFAAYLLPNTQSLFTKWRKLIISMLMLYPVAALLFAGAKLAGVLAVQEDDNFSIMIGLFITAAPLFMLPWLAKSSGGILAKVGGQLGKMGKSLQGSAQKGLAPMVQQRKDERRGQLNAGERTLNPFGKVREPNQSRDTRAYKNLRKELETGKRTGESDADWNTRRSGLERRANIMERNGEHARIQQPLAQRLALGRAKREANVGRLKKQPAEQLKELAEGAGDIDPATGLSRLERAGYSNRGIKMAEGAGSIFEREKLADTRAGIVDTRLKTSFEARHREGAILDSKVAETTLKTEQDRTGQLVGELSTEAGAALNPGLQAAASELHIAHTESQVAQMATDSAKRVATQEFADQIIQPASGLAARAGGIDQQGEARAVSKARAAVASAREESIGNIVNDHKLRPERSARWHLARLGDQDAIEKLRAEGLGALADEIGLLPPPTEEEETASIRRIKDIGGIGEALSLARLTPYLRTDQARDEAKGVTAPKLGERMPAFLSQMGNMSNAANNPGNLPIFSEEDAWVKYVNGTSFSLEDFITMPQQRDELIKFATENAASMTPGARQDVLRQLQDMRRQIEQSALAKEKIAPKAIENLDTALQQLENPPAPQQQP